MVAVVVATVAATAASAAPIVAGPARPLMLPDGVRPGRLAVADVTGDGRADVLAAAGSTDRRDRLALFPGTADDGLGAAMLLEVGGPAGRHAVGDVDADGRADVLVTKNDGIVTPARSQPGGFVLGAPMRPVDRYADVALADVDGNGALDAVFISPSRVEVHLGDGHGAFGAPVITRFRTRPTATSTLTVVDGGLAVADVTGDGRADVVAGARRVTRRRNGRRLVEGVVQTLRAADGGRFGAPVISTVGRGGVTVVLPEVSDVTGDGRPDVVAGAYAESLRVEAVLVLRGRAGGRFSGARCLGLDGCRPERDESGSYGYVETAVGDVDGDADPDLAVAEFDIGGALFAGDGAGGFTDRRRVRADGGGPLSRVVALPLGGGRTGLVFGSDEHLVFVRASG